MSSICTPYLGSVTTGRVHLRTLVKDQGGADYPAIHRMSSPLQSFLFLINEQPIAVVRSHDSD